MGLWLIIQIKGSVSCSFVVFRSSGNAIKAPSSIQSSISLKETAFRDNNNRLDLLGHPLDSHLFILVASHGTNTDHQQLGG